MSENFRNPFLAPKLEQAPQNQQSDATPATENNPQMMAQPAQQATPQMPPQPQAPQQTSPAMPQQNPFTAPQMPAQQAAPQMVPPQQVTQQPPQQVTQQATPPQPYSQQAPAQQAPAQQTFIQRETAAAPSAMRKGPSPFDFANQGGARPPSRTEGSTGRTSQRYQALSFTGGVGEYYGIVLLNYLLILVTLGVFSPWAKVRIQRYFYSHTEFLDEGFQYLAKGKQLFIGRLVAILVLVGISFAELVPLIGPLISFFAVLFGLPWVLNRAIGFNARMLAWRDVRFNWDGTFGMAMLVFVIYPILSLLTLGLAQPLAARAIRRYYADNHYFGGASFSADIGIGSFYIASIKALIFATFLCGVFGGIGGFIAYMALGDLFMNITSGEQLILMLSLMTETQQALLAIPFFGLILGLYMSGQYYMALARHIMIANLRLDGGIRFRSDLSGFGFAMLMFTNLLLNLITLGFAQPWTTIRKYRYLTQAIMVRPIADMAGFIDSQNRAGFSVFEEVSDIEGLSVDI